jgi:hypothetical protein
LSSRLFGGALSASALALFAATFAPWFAHEELDGPNGDRLRDDDTLILALSGWELEGRVSAVVLLAVFVGLGAGIWTVRRPLHRLLPVACGLAFVAAVAAAWVIGSEIRSPSDVTYTDPRLGIRLALGAAVVVAITAFLAAAVAVSRRREQRSDGVVWPLFAGAAALYALALGVNESAAWQPQALAACCVAGLLGYLIPRWWLALGPIVLLAAVLALTPDSSCDSTMYDCGESLAGLVYAFMAVVLALALLIGVATRALQRRAVRQQQV